MSISAQNTYSSIKPDLRQGNRRSSDIEQQAYAAVGRRFAVGGASKTRYVRIAFGAAAGITVLMLVTLVALLAYENINSPHARKVATTGKAEPHLAGPAVAATAKPVPQVAGVALAAAGKPVVIIDEKDEAPARPVVDASPIPPLVMLAPAALQAAPPPAPARLATAIKTPLKLREQAKPAVAAGKHAALKSAKPAHPLATSGAAARKGVRSETRNETRNDARNAQRKAPSPAKRKVAAASMAAPAQQGADGGVLTTLLSRANMQRRYLSQPVPSLAAPFHAPRRRHLSEP
ncbi:MAG TPA: hypothetical protein VF800_21025 [Telluria sp.]